LTRDYALYQGDYGVYIVVVMNGIKDKETETSPAEAVVFKSSEFFGNPYNFSIPTRQ
jgi:hypothetical protein